MEKTERLQWILSSRNNRELTERYDQWAKDYDAELKRDFDYIGPQHTADFSPGMYPRRQGF